MRPTDDVPSAPVDTTTTPPLPPPDPVTYPRPCADLYAQDLLPTFQIKMSDADWSSLVADDAQGEEVYYPITFQYGTETTSAMIRLRGNNSRCGSKLQFAISFNELDAGKRFHGLRRINLDHGGCRTLEERLALSYVRDLGLPAACANHARVVINGRYYGLFTNIEHINKDFLQRQFGADDEGNLYKSGNSLRTNETTADTSDLTAYRYAGNLATLDPLADLDEAVAEWAAEAVLPALDNYWLHGWNYYLYDHPTRGFLFIPTDFDQAFPLDDSQTYLDVRWPQPLQYPANLVLKDAAWRAKYLTAIDKAVQAFDPAVFDDRIERWYSQVKAATDADPFDSITRSEVDALKARLHQRAAWLRATY